MPVPQHRRLSVPVAAAVPQASAINPGFAGQHVGTAQNFARLTNPNYAYTVKVPAAERSVKVPAWLNDPIYYHNRGNTTFRGESSRNGDFVGLDDVMTENPSVVAGMIDIFGSWIDRFGIDGFRIDTARHVNPEFWQAFVPAMQARAQARGIPNFHIFGEVANDDFNVGYLAQHTRRDKLPTVLDFAFKQGALRTIAGTAATEVWRDFFSQDSLYDGGEARANQLPTFLGNHDQGRFGFYVRQAFPKASDEEVLDRVMLAHVLMFAARGVPTVYYGDEQGFAGDGGDQDAREDMFPSRTAVLQRQQAGRHRAATTAQSNFDMRAPALPADRPSFRRCGAIRRRFAAAPPSSGRPATSPACSPSRGSLTAAKCWWRSTPRPSRSTATFRWRSAPAASRRLPARCPVRASAPGSVRITLPPLGYAICDAAD